MDKSIITQAAIGDINFRLDELASNLNAHANTSLSKAHGINLVSGPYENNHGDVVGAYQARFTVNGNVYYAPANSTALAGQASTTGLLDPSVAADIQNAVEGSAWVTEFAAGLAASIASVNDDVLVPHTRLGHWEAHGGMAAFPKNSYDSGGYIVGDQVVVLFINDVGYEVPCSLRSGGPVQTPRITGLGVWTLVGGGSGSYHLPTPSSPILHIEPGGGESFPTYTSVVSTVAGTPPFTYKWQSSVNGSVWDDVTAVYNNYGNTGVKSNTGTPSPAFGSLAGIGSFTVYFDIKAPGGDNSGQFYMRLLVDNTSVGGAQAFTPTVWVQIKDHAGCCWFCTQANITRRLSPEEWATIGRVEQQIFRQCRRALVWYLRQGNILLAQMLKDGVEQPWFEAFTNEVLESYRQDGVEAAAKLYMKRVAKSVETHWPTCAHRGYKAGVIQTT